MAEAPGRGGAPRWTAPLARLLPPWGLRWLKRGRRRHREAAAPLSAEALKTLEPFFPTATLAVARVAVAPRLFGSRLLRLARKLGIAAVDVERIVGITFLDTIVVPGRAGDAVPLPTLFHELVHVEQARQLGPRGFVERYVRGWLAGGRRYEAIPLERDAYALERRFRAAPHEPFDVAAEVARRVGSA